MEKITLLLQMGPSGLYLVCLPVRAAHIFMRTLTLRYAEIARQHIQIRLCHSADRES